VVGRAVVVDRVVVVVTRLVVVDRVVVVVTGRLAVVDPVVTALVVVVWPGRRSGAVSPARVEVVARVVVGPLDPEVESVPDGDVVAEDDEPWDVGLLDEPSDEVDVVDSPLVESAPAVEAEPEVEVVSAAPGSVAGPGVMASGSASAPDGSVWPTEAGPGPATTCWSPLNPVEASWSPSSLPMTPRAARPTTIEATTTTARTATLDMGRHHGSAGRARGTKAVAGQGSGSSVGRAAGGGGLACSGRSGLDGTTSVDLFNRVGSGRSTMSPVRVGSWHSTESLGADAMGLSGRCGCPWRVWTDVRVGAAS